MNRIFLYMFRTRSVYLPCEFLLKWDKQSTLFPSIVVTNSLLLLCFFIDPFVVNDAPHISHTCCFWPVWTNICVVNAVFHLKRLGHKSHANGFSDVCNIWWLAKRWMVLNDFPHSAQRWPSNKVFNERKKESAINYFSQINIFNKILKQRPYLHDCLECVSWVCVRCKK